ncbi:arylesterase [Spongiibacter nanhainus]|uniref:Arylesterase n=1 Tax=Spongiibacter nanhainus TaxID=2794344 RepID=A0A7T4R482_9GAMM|nr:arylesterase [Spongiibacter nanhainus]QQD20146.1 arylesterase [Spongiibacter nanhainus]
MISAARRALFVGLLLLPLSPSSWANTLLLLGDSLSAAYNIPVSSSWPELLREKLPPHWELVNASVSGETTGGGVQRLPALLKEHEPSLVVLELGGNDGLRGYPLTRIRQNLQQLIKLSTEADAQVMLIGMQIPPNYGQRYAQGFADLFPALAEKFDLPLVSFLLEGIALQPGLMQSDGIHPTAAAQSRILDNVLPTLEPMLD